MKTLNTKKTTAGGNPAEKVKRNEMTNLIKINFESEDRPTVSGRELHDALGIETPYKKWFDRMTEYGFNECQDFWTNLSESTGGRPSTDHILTLDMAKEICMIQRTAKGKRVQEIFYRS